MINKKEVDITVYGATSFVAKHVIRYLIEAVQHQPKSFVVALGGRSKTKLEALQKSFTDYNEGSSKMFAPAVFVADGSDLAGLKKIAQKSKVILNCAGPYSQYSNNVVAACAEEGADYVDFTGEVIWVAEMRLKYGPLAKKSGARIVSLCGYDSIPSDLALFAAVQALRQKVPNAKVESGTIYHQAMGGANGGTIHTALDTPVDLKRDIFKTTTGGKQELRKVPFLMGDPLQLTHPEKVRHNPDYEVTRNRYALSEWLNQLLNFHSEFSFGVSIPMFMAPINMKVLHASSIALNYGPNFKVRERLLPCGFVYTRVLGIMGFIPAIIMQLSVLWILAVLKIPYLGKALADYLTPPGSGVPDSISSLGTTAVYATATSEVKESSSGKVDRGYAYLSFKGDPGNWTTAQCICESAFALVFDKASLPKRSDDGFGTPAEILGDVLIKRFRETKVRPVEVQINVRTDVNKNEMKVYIQDM